MKSLTLWTILVLAAAPALAQSPAHRAATNLLLNGPNAPGAPADLAAKQFPSEQAAKGHCPGDTIVWANLGGSKAYHASGDRYYGRTRHGAFMCQKEADQSGFRAAGARTGKAIEKTGGSGVK